jgi:hypothetical protein
MLVVETIARIRREHFIKGKTIKEIARDLKVSRNTVRKVLSDAIVRAASERLGSVAYRRLHQMGFKPGGIVDIGAHQGNWTREIREIFYAPTLMIEARKDEYQHLEQTARALPDTSYVIALLGAKPSPMSSCWRAPISTLPMRLPGSPSGADRSARRFGF